ncbi:hypothetical protein SSPO_003710 [Streptomyces antimycoticus]|uniref:Uncharacterized protein n=1 Tax=Streptomyces antimycoticus TaxID=68175 RepID=A0A499UAK2_9ACTN|nr:hypothetical protein SSPO_003710 [Streptomyces antimycoticus]
MRVRGHAQAPYPMDLVQEPIDQSVPDLVIPVHDLAGIDAKREPVSGLRGHFLTENNQEVVGRKMPPYTGFRSRVVLRRRHEVEPGSARPDGQLFGSEFPVRVDGVDMAVPSVPGRSASDGLRRREAQTRQVLPQGPVKCTGPAPRRA